MAPATPTSHDPALSHPPPPSGSIPQPSQAQGGGTTNLTAADLSGVHLSDLNQSQILSLLQNLPGVFNKLTDQGNLKEDAAQTLSNLAQTPQQFAGQHQLGVHYPPGGLPGINDPGPSSHPRGPPNLGQLSAVAMQAAPAVQQQQAQQQQGQQQVQRMEEGLNDEQVASNGTSKEAGSPPATSSGSTGRARGSRTATMGSDEWSRQRKDNHKEVERRRRGNINEGINELGRIVPNGSGEKAKGAILSRAVQYIHHLKENEARNIEKWTLEKLLMDQAMGDLQAQLEDVKRLWETERLQRERLEGELRNLQNNGGVGQQQVLTMQQQQNQSGKSEQEAGTKRRSEDGDGQNETDPERDGKRQRTE